MGDFVIPSPSQNFSRRRLHYGETNTQFNVRYRLFKYKIIESIVSAMSDFMRHQFLQLASASSVGL